MGGPDGVFSMGPNTLQIDRRQFHEPIRQNVVKRMQEQIPEGQRGIAVVQVRARLLRSTLDQQLRSTVARREAEMGLANDIIRLISGYIRQVAPPNVPCLIMHCLVSMCCVLLHATSTQRCLQSQCPTADTRIAERPCCLQGGSILPVYSTDGEHLFRQEPYFHYLFGVNEDDCWGALDVVNVSKHHPYQQERLQLAAALTACCEACTLLASNWWTVPATV
jgi:Rod binding domain-containing protein